MVRFLDSNIPMYAVGAEHPLKQPAVRVLADVSRRRNDYLTSVEVLQEIVHRYSAQRRWLDAGRETFDYFAELMRGRVVSVIEVDALAAADLADRYQRIDTRDLFHVAVMQRLGVEEVVSTDRGFDSISGIRRISLEEYTP